MTRAEGLHRLAAFVPHAGADYAQGRNADHGPADRRNVSMLSPFLRRRLITEHEVVASVLAQHRYEAAEKFVQEVLWRTYWKGWLEMRHAVWQRYVTERDAARATIRGSMLARAESGTTGIDGFDVWVHELVNNGYLHNHARMWFASIWIFTLCLPWTLGADFFMRHLIDADPASNTLSWRWVAGLQTPGKTYLATADNITRFTGGRFSPRGLATVAVPLTEAPLPQAMPIMPPERFDPLAPTLLLVTPGDMHPESLFPLGTVFKAARVVGHSEGGVISQAFDGAAALDTARRIEAHFGCPTRIVEAPGAAALLDAVRQAGAVQVVTPYAPVGPDADAIAALASHLAADGVRVVRSLRGWDARFWPCAQKGFFPFKAQIPAILAAQGIA